MRSRTFAGRRRRSSGNSAWKSVVYVPSATGELLLPARELRADLGGGESLLRVPGTPAALGQIVERAVLVEFDRLADEVVRLLRERRAVLARETLHDAVERRLEDGVDAGVLGAHARSVAHVLHHVPTE